jgi:hypothetical protein
MADKVVFQADTSKFTQPVERSATVVRDLSKALKEQERAARESFRDQINNAKAAGASVSELQKIEQERYRSILAIQATQKQIAAENVSNGKAAVDSAEAEKTAVDLVTRAYQQQLLAVNQTLGAVKAHHAEIAGGIAVGGGIRTLEAKQNYRAVEVFTAQVLGLGDLFQKLFPLLGGIAMAQILAEVGTKIYEVSQRAEEANHALSEFMDDAHAKSTLVIDDLAIQADKLQLNIDRLQGRPGNGLQLGLDEAKKAADELLASLSADRKELGELFKASHVSSAASWLSGVTPTGGQEASIMERAKGYDAAIQKIETEINGRYASTNTDSERTALDAERRRRIEKVMRDELTSVDTERGDLAGAKNKTVFETGADGHMVARQVNGNSVRIGELDAYKQQVQSQLSLFQYRNKIADLMQQEQSLKGGKGGQGSAAPTSAASTLRDSWDTDLKEHQQFGDLSTAAEKQFWADRVAEVKKGTDDYRFAYDRYLDAARKANTENAKLLREWNKNTDSQLDVIRDPSIISNQSRQTLKGISDANSTGLALNDAKTTAAGQAAEANIRFQEQLGLISRIDAAIQLRNLHEEQYAAQLAKLKQDLANVLPGTDADAQRNRIQQRIVELNGRHTQQQYSDAIATGDGTTSGSVGAKNALNEFVRSTRDAATQMQRITSSILNSVNDQLANAIVGDNTDWAGTFKGIGKQVAKSGLERAEGSILGAFGLGKPDGTATNPLNVRVVDGTGVPGGIGGLFGGGDSDSDSGGGIGGFFSSIFGGARAAGGDVEAGKIYRFNENGQELFAPHTSGTVIPNNKLGFGGGDNISYSIDARGTDPVQTDMRVRAAIVAAHQSSVKQAVKQVHQQSSRQPRRR